MFKNISTLIPASTFQKANSYLLHHKNQVLTPAAQFFNPIQEKQNYTPFESSTLALALSQQTMTLRNLLDQAQDDKFHKFRLEAQEQLRCSSEMTEFFIQNCYSVFKQEFDIPVKGYTSFMQACIQQNMADAEFFKQNIIPKIKQKIDYLDKDGFEDLIESLDKINYLDKKFTNLVFEKYEQKQQQQFIDCTVDGWSLDKYNNQARTSQQDIYVQYFNELKNGGFLVDQKHQLRQIQQFVKQRLVNRIFFREARIVQTFAAPIDNENNLQQIEQSKSKLLQ